MKIPTITGIIRRRLLMNYRIDPDVVRPLLPTPLAPKLINGYSIAGICLIRLEEIRPKGLPSFFGISSENSAHRFAVEWKDEEGDTQEGVFVSRRDTNARLNSLSGGRIFPGEHQHTRFDVEDLGKTVSIRVGNESSSDPLVHLNVSETDELPADSLFRTLAESSRFFEAGSIGFSVRPKSCQLEGLHLEVKDWKVSALQTEFIRSSYFDDRTTFPAGSIQFDHALLMRDIPHQWHSCSAP